MTGNIDKNGRKIKTWKNTKVSPSKCMLHETNYVYSESIIVYDHPKKVALCIEFREV